MKASLVRASGNRASVEAALAPRESVMLAELQALSVPTKKFCWHPLDRNRPRPVWLTELIRLSRSICFDLRVVDATGVNIGYPGAMTWAEILAWQTTYSAQCVFSMPPYEFGGYTNTDPTNTAQDAAHLALIQGYVDIVKAAGVTVRTVWLDTEVLSSAKPNIAGANATINTALNLKFSQVYDKIKHATTGFPSAVVGYYGLNTIQQSAAGTLTTDPNSMTNPSASPYPWDGSWGLHGWSVPYYDTNDVTGPPYTVGNVTPWMGGAIMPALYYPAEFNTQRFIIQASHRYAQNISAGKPIIGFMALGQSCKRTPASWEGELQAAYYDTALSQMYGQMFGSDWYGGTEAKAQRYWPNMTEVVTWPGPDSLDANRPEEHLVAFITGMNT